MTKDKDEFDKLLSSFVGEKKNEGIIVPVFVSLSNVGRIKVLAKRSPVKDAMGGGNEGVDDGKDSVCCMLRKKGLVDVKGGGRLKAMIVYDEADQNINGNVDQTGKDADDDTEGLGGTNKKTKAMFVAPVTVGQLEDSYGEVLTAHCLFELFSATLDVTATPFSLFFSGRDLTSRTNTGIITGSPSKYGFQYVKRPNWKSKFIDCMEVPHDDDGVKWMIDDMQRRDKPIRSRFAAVIDKTTRQKVDQRTHALRYAARYGESQLITSTWSADGVSVFTRDKDEEEYDDSDDEESDDGESSNSDAEGGCEKVGTDRDARRLAKGEALSLVHDAFNVEMQTNPELITMYKLPLGTEWQTAEELTATVLGDNPKEKAAKTKDAIDAAKARAKTTSLEEDGPPLFNMSIEGERELWETETGLEARVRDEIERDAKDLIEAAKQSAAKTTIAEYRDAAGSYPLFIDRFHKELALKSKVVNTVVFGKDIMDRGVTVKGAKTHSCGLTDMYVCVDSHCTLVIQVCGRLCGNNYHDCDKRCPAHKEEVCAAILLHIIGRPPPPASRWKRL